MKNKMGAEISTAAMVDAELPRSIKQEAILYFKSVKVKRKRL